MSDTISLGDLDTELVFEAAIDGATARHAQARRFALINRVYKRLRSIVSQNGEGFFRVPGAATTTPAQAAGEDWIELVYPTDASEIVGVDVYKGGQWHELQRGSWAQRRVFPGARSGVVGEWTELSLPQPTTTTVTAGKIAIWPVTLSGQHKIHYLPHWVNLTDSTHVLVMFPNWLEWVLTAATMVLIQRDNNKRDTFLAARDRNADMEAKIIAHSRRSRRGSVIARRRDGMEL
jgi:hypothetical protein